MAPQKVDSLTTFEVVKLITLERPKGGQTNNSPAYIQHICCRVKTWSKNSLFLSQNLVQFFSVFSFSVFQKSSSFCRENEILKITSKKWLNNTFFCVKTWSNYVAQHTWTKFWLNLGPRFWLNIFAKFLVLLPVWKNAETTSFIVFSAKRENFKPTPKNWRTLFVNTTALTVFCFVRFFCIFAFWGFCCVRLLGFFF